MYNNVYLYGTNDIMLVPVEIINDRLKKLEANRAKLLDVHYLKKDLEHISIVTKEINFWENLKKKERANEYKE